ncbi:MAG: phosphate/phosphite/phosphonate ABC transporter substrate-binding protein [Nitrospiraceae bacterium]|nr:MAG: phosphate/phosphite/phosphonate ABC transporter substrate-binding protein [Nitrospiraceae bacterium]
MNHGKIPGGTLAAARVLFLASVFVVCLGMESPAPAANPLIFAVHPYLPATEVLQRFSPLADYLGRYIGRPVRIRVSTSYEDHVALFGEGEADIAYMGSASYVKMVKRYGVRPLLARIQTYGTPTFQGIIIVRDESGLLVAKDLKGRRFAFGDPDSTMSCLVPMYMLREQGVALEDFASYKFLSNHGNVALGVLSGDFDAGAVREEIFYRYEKRGLRELLRTPPVSEYLFVADSSLLPDTVEILREALLGLAEKEEGHSVMKSLSSSITGMVPVQDRDYDDLRRILERMEWPGIAP